MQYYTAIVFFQDRTKTPMKYRNIKSKANFETFIKTKRPWYINYYDKKTKAYDGRVYLV